MNEENRPNTWGGVVAYAIEQGATLECLRDVDFGDREYRNVEYLQREVGTQTLRYPLPHGWTKERRIGPRRWMQLCGRLRIKEPSWAIEL